MERIEIPGRATYTPVALTDLMAGAPLASRLLFRATLPGQIATAGLVGYYVGSAVRDHVVRRRVRYLDFQAEYGADVDTLAPMPEAARQDEVRQLAAALNAGYVADRPAREQLAEQVARRLTAYHAGVTGQEVVISAQVRSFMLARLVFPFALGACDPVGGDIGIFKDMAVFEPHVIAHELCHRMGYFKELHAQVLGYLALRTSGDPVLVQAARAERLQRQLDVLSDADPRCFDALVDGLGLRRELAAHVTCRRPAGGGVEAVVLRAMRSLYDKRMQLTGQNGLSDYDEGFTNLLWMFGRSTTARQPTSHAAI